MRVGLVGAGFMGVTHAAGWAETDAEFVGIVAETTAEATALAKQYSLKIYPDLASMLPDVGVVDICTPTHLHHQMTLQAAAAKKDIICEKPLGRHLADAQAIVNAVEAAGVRLFVAQVVRFFPQFARAKSVIDSGAIGKPGVIRTIRAGSFPRVGGTFTSNVYADFNKSGGVILDVGIHDIDFQRWCCGEVERVFARGLTFSGLNEYCS